MIKKFKHRKIFDFIPTAMRSGVFDLYIIAKIVIKGETKLMTIITNINELSQYLFKYKSHGKHVMVKEFENMQNNWRMKHNEPLIKILEIRSIHYNVETINIKDLFNKIDSLGSHFYYKIEV